MANPKATAGLLTRILSNERVGKSFMWAAAHPAVTMGGIGSVGGFVASGFSGWGALAGGIAGYGMGVRGWKDPKKSWVVKDAGTWVERRQRMFSLIGTHPRMTEAGTFERVRRRGKMAVDLTYRGTKAMERHARQWMPRAAASAVLGGAVGFGAGMLSRSVKKANSGNTYGGVGGARYGAVFSGMGNGTVRGY